MQYEMSNELCSCSCHLEKTNNFLCTSRVSTGLYCRNVTSTWATDAPVLKSNEKKTSWLVIARSIKCINPWITEETETWCPCVRGEQWVRNSRTWLLLPTKMNLDTEHKVICCLSCFQLEPQTHSPSTTLKCTGDSGTNIVLCWLNHITIPKGITSKKRWTEASQPSIFKAYKQTCTHYCLLWQITVDPSSYRVLHKAVITYFSGPTISVMRCTDTLKGNVKHLSHISQENLWSWYHMITFNTRLKSRLI